MKIKLCHKTAIEKCAVGCIRVQVKGEREIVLCLATDVQKFAAQCVTGVECKVNQINVVQHFFENMSSASVKESKSDQPISHPDRNQIDYGWISDRPQDRPCLKSRIDPESTLHRSRIDISLASKC